MEIISIHLVNLRNEEHYQFQTEVDQLVKKYKADVLGIEAIYLGFTPLLVDEFSVLNVIRKSLLTDDLIDSNAVRNGTFRGILDTVKGSCNHFNEERQAAAKRLMIVFNTYGNVADKSYDEETASLSKLIAELQNNYSNALETMGITTWVEKLQEQNNAFDMLKKTRYSEDASKTQLKMKNVRISIDASYKGMVTRINALIIVNGDMIYRDFVNELNTRVDAFNNILAQRKGRNGKDKSKDNTDNTDITE